MLVDNQPYLDQSCEHVDVVLVEDTASSDLSNRWTLGDVSQLSTAPAWTPGENGNAIDGVWTTLQGTRHLLHDEGNPRKGFGNRSSIQGISCQLTSTVGRRSRKVIQ